MRWRGRRQSTNVQDRRKLTPGKAAAGGGIGMIVIAVVMMFLGKDPSAFLRGAAGTTQSSGATSNVAISPKDQEMADFVSVVLADTEDVWKDLFRREGKTYEEPELVLFRGRTEWAGGMADKAMGPFYSPTDKKVFIDLSFFEELKQRYKAPGDFAQAYVVAHEIGHHVQHLLGISDRVHRMRKQVSKTEYNRLSVRLELQADFFAGVWAHHAHKKHKILEEGDIEEALTAASAIGDDRLQKQARGHAVPDSFTHGTSAQRVAWFRYGLRSGDPAAGNIFDDRIFSRINPR